MGPYSVIGIGGVAGAGKDTLCQLLIDELASQDEVGVRFALADALKRDLDDLFKEKIGVSAFTSNQEEKRLIRPILVEWGRVQRLRSEGTYWTNKLKPLVESAIQEGKTPIITDIRYGFYPKDEIYWVKEINGLLVHIQRTFENKMILPPNKDEEENDPKVKEAAHLKLIWSTVKDIGSLRFYAKSVVKSFFNGRSI